MTTITKLIAALSIALLFFSSCKKDEPTVTTHYLIFKFKFDSTQERLNNLGEPSTIPAGNSAQSPVFNGMSSHYIEMTANEFTALGGGDVLYHAPETTIGGSTAIDFDSSVVAPDGGIFYKTALANVTPGTYNWLRISLAYQNYDIRFRSSGYDLVGTIASFIGFNTYIRTFTVNTVPITVNANKLQGYWAFETLGIVSSGQAPAGATTVPNPLFATSPIPQGSCVVTGQFQNPLTIAGTEDHDITIVVSLSTNKSFEWKDANSDGIFEVPNDTVVDMGVRGLIPIVQ